MKLSTLLLAFFFGTQLQAQQTYWQQQLRYNISATLNDQENQLPALKPLFIKTIHPRRSILSGFISGPMPTDLILLP